MSLGVPTSHFRPRFRSSSNRHNLRQASQDGSSQQSWSLYSRYSSSQVDTVCVALLCQARHRQILRGRPREKTSRSLGSSALSDIPYMKAVRLKFVGEQKKYVRLRKNSANIIYTANETNREQQQKSWSLCSRHSSSRVDTVSEKTHSHTGTFPEHR